MAVIPEFGIGTGTPAIAFYRSTDYGVDPPLVLTQITYDPDTDTVTIPDKPGVTTITPAELHAAALAVQGFNDVVRLKLRPVRTAYPPDADVRVRRQPDGDVTAEVLFGEEQILDARYRFIQADVRFPAIAERQTTWSGWMIYATAFMLLSAQVGGPNSWYR